MEIEHGGVLMDNLQDRPLVEALRSAGPGDRSALLDKLRTRLLTEQRFKTDLKVMTAKLPDSKYLDYIRHIDASDLESTILVQIPAYQDSELLKTIQSARAQAANPDRIIFAICLQDSEENKHMLDGILNLRYTFIPVDQASGSCRARWECQELYDGEDYVLITDSHMRFARFWDVMEIAQWKACGDEKAILSEYAADYSSLLNESVGSDRFTEAAKPFGRYVGALYFLNRSCMLCMWGRGGVFRSERPMLGAFTGCAHVFGRGEINDIRFDPGMCFHGDEFIMAARWWTHGFNIYHPSMRYVFHLYGPTPEARAKRQAQAGHSRKYDIPGPDGVTPREKELARAEQLFGIASHGIDLGAYGLGAERGLDEYERFSGVSVKNHTYRVFSRLGPFGGDHTPEESELFG